jgi:hypothetical protein
MQTQADHEYDSEAPYGRKPNGQPYKTKPSFRRAMGKYHKKKYAENPQIQMEANKRWIQKNREKVNQYGREQYYKKKAELEYYKELFTISLETI